MRKRNINFNWFIAVLLIGSIFLSGFLFSGNIYAGGWEVQNGLSVLEVDSSRYTSIGVHYLNIDTDGEWRSGVQGGMLDPGEGGGGGDDTSPNTELPTSPDASNNPNIIIEMSYPRFLKSDETYTKTYDVNVADNEIIRYTHWEYLYDVTIKTAADKYLKPWGQFWDYGWFFEANVVDVNVQTKFSLNPWTPTGTNGEWDIVDGWAGIMSASIYDVQKGLLQPEKLEDENYGHTITNIDSKGAALNTHIGSFDFDSPSGLQGVPSSVYIDNHANLGAGAEYTEFLGHWDSVAVRNIYIKYTIRVDVLTTLDYKLRAGVTYALEPPSEDNTAYRPQNSVLNSIGEFFAGIYDGIMNFGLGLILPILVVVVIIVVVIFVVRPLIKLRKRR